MDRIDARTPHGTQVAHHQDVKAQHNAQTTPAFGHPGTFRDDTKRHRALALCFFRVIHTAVSACRWR